jgi:hypothetical protein
VLCGIKTIWRLTLEAAAAKPGGMSERGRERREEKGRAHLELKSLASETPEGCSSGVEVLSLPGFSSVVRLIWMISEGMGGWMAYIHLWGDGIPRKVQLGGKIFYPVQGGVGVRCGRIVLVLRGQLR